MNERRIINLIFGIIKNDEDQKNVGLAGLSHSSFHHAQPFRIDAPTVGDNQQQLCCLWPSQPTLLSAASFYHHCCGLLQHLIKKKSLNILEENAVIKTALLLWKKKRGPQSKEVLERE